MWFIKLKKSNRCVFLSAQELAGAARLEGLLGPYLGAGSTLAVTSLDSDKRPSPINAVLHMVLRDHPDH